MSVPVTGQQEPSGVAGTAQQAASGSAAVSAGTATVEQAQREQLASSAAAGVGPCAMVQWGCAAV